MAQNTQLARLSDELEKIRKALDQYTHVNNTLKNSKKTNATGLSAVLKNIWTTLKDYTSKLPELFFGKSSTNSNEKAANPMDYGLAYITGILASIDLCSIINTLENLAGKISIQNKFNPSQNPPPNDPKWKIQKLAYDIQKSIDVFESAYAVASDPSTIIINLISEISPNLTRLTTDNYLGSSEIRKAYPQVDTINNYIIDVVKKFSNINVISNSDKTTIDKILKTITLIRQSCVLIQGLTSPANLATYAANILDPGVFKTIDKLGVDNINPKELTKIISQIDRVSKTINNILGVIIRYLNFIKLIIRTSLVLIKIFKIIIQFLDTLPLPNMYTTTGTTTTFAKKSTKLEQYVDDTVGLLNEVNVFISLIVGILQGVADAINIIVGDLDTIASNLRSCSRDGSNTALNPLADSLEATSRSLKDNNNEIIGFIKNYNGKQKNTTNTYQGYTIQIITEKIQDQQVQKLTIPRRFGIALNSDNIEVVESTPTFASDDNIIIDEVKLLLATKGLIKPQNSPSAFTSAQQDIITQASNILEIDNILTYETPEDNPDEQMDSPDNENDDSGLGVNAYFNKTKGGRKLRRRVQNKMNAKRIQLTNDLKAAKN